MDTLVQGHEATVASVYAVAGILISVYGVGESMLPEVSKRNVTKGEPEPPCPVPLVQGVAATLNSVQGVLGVMGASFPIPSPSK